MKEVKPSRKPMIYYYAIVVIALLLFNFLAVPFITEREIRDVDYGTFIDMTNEGKVEKAEIQSRRTPSFLRTRTKDISTGLPWCRTMS